jgi:hypothetical protein
MTKLLDLAGGSEVARRSTAGATIWKISSKTRVTRAFLHTFRVVSGPRLFTEKWLFRSISLRFRRLLSRRRRSSRARDPGLSEWRVVDGRDDGPRCRRRDENRITCRARGRRCRDDSRGHFGCARGQIIWRGRQLFALARLSPEAKSGAPLTLPRRKRPLNVAAASLRSPGRKV